MSEAAHGPRRRTSILLRRTAFDLLRWVYRIAGRLSPRRAAATAGRIAVVLPVSAGPLELGAARNRVAWYLGGGHPPTQPPVDVLVPEELSDTLPVVPEWEQDHTAATPPVRTLSRGDHDPAVYDHLLFWRARDVLSPRIWPHIARVRIIGPDFYSGVDGSAFQEVMAATVDRESYPDLLARSRQNFQDLLSRHGGAETVYVLGTGPSVEEMRRHDPEGAPVVVCNSLVRDTGLLDHLRPAAVCFADEVFHYGPSRYAEAFRRDLLAVLARYDCHAVTRPWGAALLLRHHPELADRLIALPEDAPGWNVPSDQGFRVRATGNILTFYMLPLGAALGRRIRVGGSDGRRRGETYFWRHGPSVQYEGLMETAFRTHPAFFRDRIYTDYYRRHLRLLGDQVAWLERQGHPVESITATHIPVLRRRAVTV
jgi:hypothetical protein